MHVNLTLLGQLTSFLVIWFVLGPLSAFTASRIAKLSGLDAKTYRNIAFMLGFVPMLGWLYVATLSLVLKPRGDV